MNKREERINNLFDDETGRGVMIPMDHGIMFGVQKGLEDPVEALKRFTNLNPEALLVNFGVLKLTHNYLKNLDDAPGIIMGVDFNLTWDDWKTSINAGEVLGHCKIANIKHAVEYGVDAVKVLFPLGLDPDLQLDYIDHTTDIIAEAEDYDMPVIVEPLTVGKHISKERKNDPEIIADGCRLALELGADLIKAPYPGSENQEAFSEICRNANVPIIMLGGPKKGGVKGILRTAREGIDAGARGTIFGRNVWQRPVDEMKKVVKSLQDIVHNGATVEESIEKYGL